MQYSIEGYYLRGVKEKETSRGYAFEASLCYEEFEIAFVENKGDGIDMVMLNRQLPETTFQKVVMDMKTLLELLEKKGVLKEEALARDFAESVDQAIIGFVYLLLDLRDLALTANKAEQANPDPSCYRVVMQLHESWFSDDIPIDGAEFVFKTLHFPPNTSMDDIRQHVLEDMMDIDMGKTLVRALAIYTDKMNWNLSFEDYASLYSI